MGFFSLEYASQIWLAIGVIIIVFEFFITPGLGVVFAGFGALTTGALLETGTINSPTEQLIVFAGSSILWTILLWKPLKRTLANKNLNKGESHIIGTEATIAAGGVTKTSGKAKWSGTEMSAKITHGAKIDELKEGEVAEVIALEGSTLILNPKQH